MNTINTFNILVTVTLSYGENKLHLERACNIKLFIDKYSWQGISYLPKIDDCKTFAIDNVTIALITLHIKGKKIYPACISKHYLIHKKQIILLIVPNEEKEGWHYLAVQQLSD